MLLDSHRLIIVVLVIKVAYTTKFCRMNSVQKLVPDAYLESFKQESSGISWVDPISARFMASSVVDFSCVCTIYFCKSEFPDV